MKKGGFTLIELIIAVGIIALLAAISVVAINPAKRIGQSNDSQRWADLTAISKAVELYTADNGTLPSDFAVTNIAQGEKLVLCSSAASLTCDGQTEACLVVNDTDFLGSYLPDLPIDPDKSTITDTGYYVTRGGGDNLMLGACDSYSSTNIELNAQVAMNPLVAVCGDGDVEGGEVCDDGNNFNEGCGNATLETAGSYCNYNCTAVISITVDEVCDSDFSNICFDNFSHQDLYSGSYVHDSSCNKFTDSCNGSCSYCSVGCSSP